MILKTTSTNIFENKTESLLGLATTAIGRGFLVRVPI